MKKEHLILALKQKGFNVETDALAEILLSHQASENAIDIMLGTYAEPNFRQQYVSATDPKILRKFVSYNPLAEADKQIQYENVTLVAGFVKDYESSKKIFTSDDVVKYDVPQKGYEYAVCGFQKEIKNTSVYKWEHCLEGTTPEYFINNSQFSLINDNLIKVYQKWRAEQESFQEKTIP